MAARAILSLTYDELDTVVELVEDEIDAIKEARTTYGSSDLDVHQILHLHAILDKMNVAAEV